MEAIVQYPDGKAVAAMTRFLHGVTMHEEGSWVEPRTDQTQFRRELNELRTDTNRSLSTSAAQRVWSEGKHAYNMQLHEAAVRRATELASVAGPTHLLALAAEGLKRCTGVREQITVPSIQYRFRQQMQGDLDTFHLLHQQLRNKKLLVWHKLG
ncbi:hypothetical protein CVIRNUC_010586 [Coccomyxa viridis]|uniref:Uncharacterized protein n=1 Tax=Coccomyxa viridis TaxID=1274662 RepID=A0AAV1IJ71_9CHLO|nr:hypothetical protein CVIRNUC_010586 [Coccomyxa viridis]